MGRAATTGLGPPAYRNGDRSRPADGAAPRPRPEWAAGDAVRLDFGDQGLRFGRRAVTALDGVISAFASRGVHSRDGPVGTGKPALLQVAAGIGWSPPARFASAASSSAVALPLRLNGRRLKPKAVR